jgi:hypothetical protein
MRDTCDDLPRNPGNRALRDDLQGMVFWWTGSAEALGLRSGQGDIIYLCVGEIVVLISI